MYRNKQVERCADCKELIAVGQGRRFRMKFYHDQHPPVAADCWSKHREKYGNKSPVKSKS